MCGLSVRSRARSSTQAPGTGFIDQVHSKPQLQGIRILETEQPRPLAATSGRKIDKATSSDYAYVITCNHSYITLNSYSGKRVLPLTVSYSLIHQDVVAERCGTARKRPVADM